MYSIGMGEVQQAMPVTAPSSSAGPTHTATSAGILRRPAIISTGAIANIGTITARTTPAGPVVAAKSQSPFIQTLMDTRPQTDTSDVRPQSGPTEPRPTEDELVPEPEKKGLPIWAWAAIGVGGLAVVGGIAYFVMRKKPSVPVSGLGLSRYRRGRDW